MLLKFSCRTMPIYIRGRKDNKHFLELDAVKHIYNLYLNPRTRKWSEQVTPGYQFLFKVLKEAQMS